MFLSFNLTKSFKTLHRLFLLAVIFIIISFFNTNVYADTNTNSNNSDTAATGTASKVNADYTLSNGGSISRMTDGSYNTSTSFNPDDSITVTSDTPIHYIYIKWNRIPSEWTLSYDNKQETHGTDGFLHECITLSKDVTEFSITFSSNEAICDIQAYSSGTLPSDVQQWNKPCDKADILVFSTHADDEILFLGGILATYGGDKGLNVQVAYMCNFFYTEAYREHEKLDGLWTAGIKHYPVTGDFKDVGSRSLKLAMSQYSYDDVSSYVMSVIRRFKPLVCVSQDLSGEYGHGGHMLYAKAVSECVLTSNNADSFKDSADLYGVWDVPKTYMHLYPENKITLQLQTPLKNMNNLTAIAVAQNAYDMHVSQHKWDFTITDDGYVTTGNAAYSCSDFGLYRSTVGNDTGNDILENITTYEEQERIETERIRQEELSRQAEQEQDSDNTEEASENENTQSGRKMTTRQLAVNLIAIFIIGIIIYLQYRKSQKIYNKKQ